jgi:hypothetical protein
MSERPSRKIAASAILAVILAAVCPVRGAPTASYRTLNRFPPAAAEWQACPAEPAARQL